ncbi:sigma factor [Aestuariivirga sp.]|uniref:sigma factor n=1 Tax=Aestuariivirga sp. TaxID=2650926 RepID=UPI0035943036
MQRQHTSDDLLDEAKASFAIIAAQHRGHRLARQISDPARDREDHRQDILLDLISRADRFDPVRGSWGAFVTVVTRNAALTILQRHAHSVAITGCNDEVRPAEQRHVEAAAILAIDTMVVQQRLPASLQNILAHVAETGTVTDAQRRSGQPAASFYRGLRQLRLRLIAAGLAPTRITNTSHVASSNWESPC